MVALAYTVVVRLDELFEHVVDYAGEAPSLGVTEAGGSAVPMPQARPTGVEALPGSGGAYLLTDAEDRIIQLATAMDLRRALRARLGRPEHPAAEPAETMLQPGTDRGTALEQGAGKVGRPRADLRTITRRIWWCNAHSVFETTYVYYRIARVLMPEAYLKNIGFGPAWFVHVDPEAAIPRFAAGKVLRSPPGVDLGPFATQTDANRFVQILEDTFDLCRYYHILEQTPHGQACAYFEMGRCPAPCDGSIPMSQYQRMIGSALAFARGDRQQWFTQREQQMKAAAGTLEFEKAARLKQRIERAGEIEHAAFRLVRPIEDFSWLIVQRGPGQVRVKPFFVQAGRITLGAVVKLKDLPGVIETWIAGFQQPAPVAGDRASGALQELSEHLWLVSHFLFKREPVGLFLDAGRLPPPAELAEQIRSYFSRRDEAAEHPGGAAAALQLGSAPSELNTNHENTKE